MHSNCGSFSASRILKISVHIMSNIEVTIDSPMFALPIHYNDMKNLGAKPSHKLIPVNMDFIHRLHFHHYLPWCIKESKRGWSDASLKTNFSPR
jgi:hypothetical protein